MRYFVIIAPTGQVSHASRDGVHAVCSSAVVGTVTEVVGGYVNCYRCRPKMGRSAQWVGPAEAKAPEAPEAEEEVIVTRGAYGNSTITHVMADGECVECHESADWLLEQA